MTERVTAGVPGPIYAALLREIPELDTGDWDLSAPPEFAAELIQSVLGASDREDDRTNREKPARNAEKSTSKRRPRSRANSAKR